MAKSFRDNVGREWSIEVTYGTLKRVRDLAGLDLTQIADPGSETQRRLNADPILMLECVAAAIAPQLESRGLGPDDLFAAMESEEVGEAAAVALFEATTDFFRPGKREAFRRILARTCSRMDAARKQGETTIRELEASGELDRIADQAIDAVLGATSGRPAAALPDSSASTTSAIPCAS